MRTDRSVLYRFVRSLSALAALLLLVTTAAAESGFEPFFRFDGGLNAWQEPLKNVRFLTRDAYTLTPLEADLAKQAGLDPEAMPDTKGMDTLNISGSAEFSEDSFVIWRSACVNWRTEKRSGSSTAGSRGTHCSTGSPFPGTATETGLTGA